MPVEGDRRIDRIIAARLRAEPGRRGEAARRCVAAGSMNAPRPTWRFTRPIQDAVPYEEPAPGVIEALGRFVLADGVPRQEGMLLVGASWRRCWFHIANQGQARSRDSGSEDRNALNRRRPRMAAPAAGSGILRQRRPCSAGPEETGQSTPLPWPRGAGTFCNPRACWSGIARKRSTRPGGCP